MLQIKNILIFTVLVILSLTTARRIPRQVSSNDFAQFGFFVDDDQIVRRNPNASPQQNNNNQISTTEQPATTASPQYLACMERCRSTQEYNPVCGTDMINYHNQGRLTCAQGCGKNVQRVRLGTCLPL